MMTIVVETLFILRFRLIYRLLPEDHQMLVYVLEHLVYSVFCILFPFSNYLTFFFFALSRRSYSQHNSIIREDSI